MVITFSGGITGLPCLPFSVQMDKVELTGNGVTNVSPRLVARLRYGSGLRQAEALRLRVKDLDRVPPLAT